MKPTWSVAAVFESEAAKSRALNFCDELVVRFWESCGFDIHWVSFDDLQNEAAAEISKAAVRKADIILIAAEAPGEFPLEMILWLQESLAARNEKEGVMVGLFTPGESTLRDGHCRSMAHSHGLDYWTEIPHELAPIQPDSPDWCQRRAGQITTVLDQILHQSGSPPRFWE